MYNVQDIWAAPIGALASEYIYWTLEDYCFSLYCVVEVTVMELTIISAPSVVDQTTTSARLAINESAYDVSRDLISSHDTVSSVSPHTPKA